MLVAGRNTLSGPGCSKCFSGISLAAMCFGRIVCSQGLCGPGKVGFRLWATLSQASDSLIIRTRHNSCLAQKWGSIWYPATIALRSAGNHKLCQGYVCTDHKHNQLRLLWDCKSKSKSFFCSLFFLTRHDQEMQQPSRAVSWLHESQFKSDLLAEVWQWV